MKFISKSLLFAIIITVLSCSNKLDRSVIEPMEIEDIKEVIEKDSLFEVTYTAVQKIRDNVLTDDIKKAKWSDVTYERVHDIFKIYSDSITQSEYTKEIRREWLKKYDKYDEKVDSIVAVWQKYLDENSLSSYVDIELFDVQTTENGKVKVGFKISPLRNGIKDLIFEYIFINNKDTEEISNWDRYSILNKDTNKVYLFEDISESMVHWDFNIINEKDLNNQILEEILEKYVFKFKINSLKQNRIRISDYDLQIPKMVERYIRAKKTNSHFDDYYKEGIIKEFLNKDYVRFETYKQPFIDSIIKSKDAKVIDFLSLNKG